VLNFTTQERAVILFLAVTLVLGSVIGIVRDRKLEKNLIPARVAEEAEKFDSVSKAINAASLSAMASTDSSSGMLLKAGSGKTLQREDTGRININTATAQELEQLPGVGPALAARIVAHREQVGDFRDPRTITDVKGIGEKLYAAMADKITIE